MRCGGKVYIIIRNFHHMITGDILRDHAFHSKKYIKPGTLKLIDNTDNIHTLCKQSVYAKHIISCFCVVMVFTALKAESVQELSEELSSLIYHCKG